MFGKISDKTKRDAYLKALSSERADYEAEQKAKKSAPSFDVGLGEVESYKNPEGRTVVSGKEAIKLAGKNLAFSGTYDQRAIIDKKTADMRFYSNWRDRLDELENDVEPDEKDEEQDEILNFDLDGADGDENGREPGIDGNDTTLFAQNKDRSTKSFLDSLMPSSTRQEGEDSTGDLLNSLFANRRRNQHLRTKIEDAEDVDQTQRKSFINTNIASAYANSKNKFGEDFEDDNFDDSEAEDEDVWDELPELEEEPEEVEEPEPEVVKPKIPEKKASVSKPAEKSKKTTTPRKKKKKYDADIIGVGDFFTVR
ncbi:MAG: hypothetical protein IJS68_00860 [Clostridia bacterium]|nr:hypothetical protein [Clostridia bacterium]